MANFRPHATLFATNFSTTFTCFFGTHSATSPICIQFRDSLTNEERESVIDESHLQQAEKTDVGLISINFYGGIVTPDDETQDDAGDHDSADCQSGTPVFL